MNISDSGKASLLPQDVEVCDVIVPVLNELEMLPTFLKRLDSLEIPMNIIMVDNGSTDGTIEYVEAIPGIKFIKHGVNLGYGRSLADGLAASTAEKVIIIDADCEYPPEAIPAVLDALDETDVVYASRFRGAGIDMSWMRAAGNRGLSRLFNLLYRQRLTDLYTGMKGLRRQAFDGLEFRRSGFEHVAELAARMSRRGCRFEEIPVAYASRQTGRSKMRHVPELIKAVFCLAYYRVAGDA